MKILGISAFYHDSAAALVRRRASSSPPPRRSASPARSTTTGSRSTRSAYCLRARRRRVARASTRSSTTTSRSPRSSGCCKTYLRVGPKGIGSFSSGDAALDAREAVDPVRDRAGAASASATQMPKDLCFTEHHESHAASAFFPSPFEAAAVLTFDGVGEWATSSVGVGRGQPRSSSQRQLLFPNSLGLLYSAFTYFCGFRVNSGEYKLMGLAPVRRAALRRRDPRATCSTCATTARSAWTWSYFGYLGGLTMTNRRFADLFGGPPREAGVGDHPARDGPRRVDPGRDRGGRAHASPAHAAEFTGERDACLAGGVALNCVANGRAAARGAVRADLDPARGRRRRRRRRRGAVRLAPDPRPPARRRRRRDDSMQRRVPRARLLGRRDRGATARRSGYPYERLTEPDARADGSPSCDRRRQGRRALRRGGWSSARARSGTARSSATRARPTMQSIDEPQDQVPRVVPAVRPGGARRAGQRVLRHRRRVAVHAARRRRPRAPAPLRRAARATATCATWVNEVRSEHPGRDPRRLLRAPPDRPPRAEPGVPRDPRGVRRG